MAVKTLTRVAGLAIVLYGAACLAAWAMQDDLVFHPTVGSGENPGRDGLEFEVVELETSDRVKLHGWYVPAPADAVESRTVLFLHGNAGNISHRRYTLKTLHSLGHAVLIIDYRGFGQSGGKPSESGTYRDAEAAWNYLVATRGVASGEIVIYGRSLGGAVAAALASAHEPRGLILESTFSSITDMARHRYPLLPVDWLLTIRYDTAARLAGIHCPVLVAHSPEDAIVPYSMAAKLADRAPGTTEVVALRGSHNRAFRRSGADYYSRLDRFIRQPH